MPGTGRFVNRRLDVTTHGLLSMHTHREQALRDALACIEVPPPETSFLRLKQWKSRRKNVLRLFSLFPAAKQ
jgi:hypothetical protein